MSTAVKRMLIGSICLIIGIGLGVFGLKKRATGQKLDAEGVVVQGTVLDGEMKTGRRGSKSYSVTVTYSPQGSAPGQFQHKFSVSSTTFDTIESQGGIGAAVQVRYLPSDPSVCDLESDRDYGMFFLIGGPIAALVGVGFLVAGLAGRNG